MLLCPRTAPITLQKRSILKENFQNLIKNRVKCPPLKIIKIQAILDIFCGTQKQIYIIWNDFSFQFRKIKEKSSFDNISVIKRQICDKCQMHDHRL